MVSKAKRIRKTALITGGAGFIGSYLCERFAAEGYRVIAVDNLITGSVCNLDGLKRHPRFDLIRHDITRPLRIRGPVHRLLHFASPASPIDYLKIPIQTLKVGALGTHHMLGMAKLKRARYLLASTSEVYGDPLVHPQPETYWGNVNPVGPRAVYDEAKRFAEAITVAYHNMHKVDTRIVRIFNTYGPRMRPHDGRAVPTFINQALGNRPMTVFGQGMQTRSFCYVTDLVEGLWRLLHSQIHTPVNIGNPKEFTIMELAKTIIRLTGSRSRIVRRPLPKDDPRVRRPDIRLARKMLKWTPKMNITKGLRETITWFKELK
jgi:dTDP-glucose 4,6-dehydratase